MSGHYGDAVAKSIVQNQVAVVATAWTPLVAQPSTGLPYENRRQIRYQIKSNSGGTMALAYVSRNADGTFTNPSTDVSPKTCTVMAGNTTWVEPIGDTVMVYGKLVKKAGFTFDSIRVIVTEYR